MHTLLGLSLTWLAVRSTAAAAAVQHMLAPAGPQATRIHDLWVVTVIICSLVFAAVLAAFLVVLWRAPRADLCTPPDLSPAAPEPRPQRTVISAVAVSVLLLLFMVIVAVFTDRALARLPLRDALHVEVTARQWWWDLRYDHPQPSRTFTTANELHVPVGRAVVVTLKAEDVIHSFWVPSLAGKNDLIPGRSAILHLRADAAGTFRGQCVEFCGPQHARMAFVVIAEPPEQYEAWAERQRQPAPEPVDAVQARGRQIFETARCAMCHRIAGTSAGGRLAPDLTHLAGRSTIAAGTLSNTPGQLASWIIDPQRFKPGANMPPNALALDDLRALLAYLGSLK